MGDARVILGVDSTESPTVAKESNIETDFWNDSMGV